MISSEEEVTVVRDNGLSKLANILVNYTNGFASGLKIASVTNHVTVSKIDDKEFVGMVGDGFESFLSDLLGGHLRLGNKSFRFGGGDLDESFVGVRSFSAAIEEVGDVGIFFGFRDMSLVNT